MKEANKPARRFGQKRTVEKLPHPFTRDEIRQLGIDLAHATRKAIRIENDKAVAMAAFNAAKKEAEGECAALSLKLETGYELRDTECVVHFSRPGPGQKTVVRLDNNEFVREEPMTAEEMQAAFDFPDAGGKDRPQ